MPAKVHNVKTTVATSYNAGYTGIPVFRPKPFTIGITCQPVGKYHLIFMRSPWGYFINKDGIDMPIL